MRMQPLVVTIISVARSGLEIGDYYLDVLKDGLESGYFLADDYGWYQGLTEWRPLPEIVGTLAVQPEPGSAPEKVNPLLVQAFRKSVDKIATGKSNLAKERKTLHDLMDSIGIKPNDHIYLNEFIDPVLNTNVDLIYGFRQWKEGNREGAREAFPADELIGFENRMVPREWLPIWGEARAKLTTTTATDASATGRMVAMKNDPIWTAISEFGLPFPPFKRDGGVGVLDVSYEESVGLGVMGAAEDPLPPPELSPNFEQILISTLNTA